MGRIIASSVRNKEHIAVYDDVTKQAMEGIETNEVFIYLLDVVKDTALIHLAWQYDVLGFKGWALAQTDDQRRELLKKAIQLHKSHGTPFAIKSAIVRAVGGLTYNDITIHERLVLPTFIFDGLTNFNGSHYFGPGHWATFNVTINVTGFGGPITTSMIYLVTQLILQWKNARSWLINLSFGYYFEEGFNMGEEFGYEIHTMPSEITNFTFRFDGQNNFDGSRQFQQDYFVVNVLGPPIPMLAEDNDDILDEGGDPLLEE